MALECPVCLNSLLSPSQSDVRCLNPDCRGGPSCAGCVTAEVATGNRQRRCGGRAGPSNAVTGTCATPCGHIFHRRCLNGWMQESNARPTCPTCRRLFTKGRVISVYLNTSEESTEADVNSGFQSVQSGTVDNAVLDVDPVPYDGDNMDDLKIKHNTLISDYTELRTKYWDLKDEYEFAKAQVVSLEQELQNAKEMSDDDVLVIGNGPAASVSVSNARKRGSASRAPCPRVAKRGRPRLT